MFGYVMPDKGELKIKNYNLYRAFYCGICKSISRRYGQLPRMLLNYDTTFYAIFIAAFIGQFELYKDRCFLKGRGKSAFARGYVIDLAADLNILLAYYKLVDNKIDDKSFLARAGCVLYSGANKKAGIKQPVIIDSIKTMYSELRKLEQLECWSVEVAAKPFSDMLVEIVAETLKDADDLNNTEKLKAAKFAELLGKWIYTIDAVDDFEKDVKDKCYNPLKYADNHLQTAEIILFSLMSEMSEVFEQFEMKKSDLKDIIENVLYAGMLSKTDHILKGKECSECDESIRSSWCKRKCITG